MAKIVKLGMSCKKYSKKKKNGQEMQKKKKCTKISKKLCQKCTKTKKNAMEWAVRKTSKHVLNVRKTC